MKEYKCVLFNYLPGEVVKKGQERKRVYGFAFKFKCDLDDLQQGVYCQHHIKAKQWKKVPLQRDPLFPDDPLREIADCCYKFIVRGAIGTWDATYINYDIKEVANAAS